MELWPPPSGPRVIVPWPSKWRTTFRWHVVSARLLQPSSPVQPRHCVLMATMHHLIECSGSRPRWRAMPIRPRPLCMAVWS